jgi:hypothetical protein
MIDGLIRDILNEAEAPAPSGRGRASTLMETAMAAAPSSPMALEKLLLEALAPRIVTVLERTMPTSPPGSARWRRRRPTAAAASQAHAGERGGPLSSTGSQRAAGLLTRLQAVRQGFTQQGVAGMARGASSFSACSAPSTGRPAGSSSPTWTSSEAWSQ